MKGVLITVLFAALVISAASGGLGAEPVNEPGVGISVSTDRTTYAVGEPIVITLKVFNHTGEEITFNFSSSKRYDFVIEDDDGNELWRWSEARMFLMVLGEDVLGPGKEETTYTEKYEGELEQGDYKITGTFEARERPMSGSVSMVVK